MFRVLRPWVLFVALGFAIGAPASDWPQLARDAGRTARTPDSVEPNFRARWIWVGPDRAPLRNRNSQAGWPDDLSTRDGYSYPMPTRVGFTFADTAQPVIAQGRLFLGDQQGRVFGIDAATGATLWTAELPGGTSQSGAVSGSTVVFASLSGRVRGFDVASGKVRWEAVGKKASTTAPCLVGTDVMIADHGGSVTCYHAATGKRRWSVKPGGPILGGVCSDGSSVYVPAEDMRVYALGVANGAVRASAPAKGQSFRLNHPVVHAGLLWVQSATVPSWGSEYTMQGVMAGATSIADEESRTLRWLTGDTNGGQWPDASVDWKHLHAFRTSDMTEPFTVPAGPVDGCGIPAMPVCIGPTGRPLTWFPTRFPKLTNIGAFGTNHSIDLCEIDPTTGRRIAIDRGRLANMWMIETDNLYALTSAGNYLWMRQWFRGTQVIRLADAWHRMVVNRVRREDGSAYTSDVIYFDTPPPETVMPEPPLQGRAAPVVVDGRVYQQEGYCITCIESRGGAPN